MNRHERRAAARLGRNTSGSSLAGDPFALAVQYFQAGRLAESERAGRQALQLDPRHPGALHLLGVIALQNAEPQQALEFISRAIEFDPQPPTFHNNCGSALRGLGRHAEAESCFRRALALRPDYVRALVNLGHVLTEIGKTDEAIVQFRRALTLAPNDLDGCIGLAELQQKRGALDEAATCYEQASTLAPQLASLQHNLAIVRAAQGRMTEAINAFRRAAQLQPNDVNAWMVLAAALEKQVRLTEAVTAYREAIRCAPAQAECHHALGNVLAHLGQLDAAVLAYREAIRFAPDNLLLRSNLIMTMHSHAGVSAADILVEARAFDARARQGRDVTPDQKATTVRSDRPPRIGYVSADFRVHPVGFFLERVLPVHDPNAFEVFLYSDVQFADELTDRLRSSVKHYRAVVGKDDAALAQIIAEDGIDILVDLAGHTGFNRLGLFARRAAPLQISWLGYFGTTGLSEMDFVVADATVIPQGEESLFSENVFRIDSPYLSWSPPQANISVGPFPALSCGQVTFGSFNNRTKLNPETITAWIRILQRVKDSRLLFKSWAFGDASCCDTLAAVFAEHGIQRERLLFEGLSPRDEGLAAYNKIDIALDPFPFGGCTTTADTLWMGVPLVTQAGARWSGRMSQTILSTLGLKDWVARDTDNYVELAVRMAGSLTELASLRASLRHKIEASPFCDGTAFTARLEDAYRSMWQAR